MKALMKHTAIGMTVQRICRWLFHFLLHFGANMEKNIASTSLGFPAYLATPPCDNGISCANKGWNLTFAGARCKIASKKNTAVRPPKGVP